MPNASAPARTSSGAAPQQTKTAKPVAAIPFSIASRRKFSLGPAMPGPAMSATVNQNLGPVEITPTGFLRFLKLTITATTSANAATVVFSPDGPWNCLQYVTLTNASGDTIIVPVDGFMVYIMNKYGALSSEPPWNDPKSSPQYFSTTGVGAGLGGSFRFSLRIPLEIDPETAFGAIASMASNKTLQLGLQIAPTTVVYTTAPTTPPVMSPVMYQAFWAQPKGDNGRNIPQQTSPDGNNSLMQWRLETPTVTAGDKLIKFNNIGNVFRFFVFIYRTAAGARTSVDIPALHTFRLNNDEVQYLPDLEWQEDMAQNYGYIGTLDAAQGLDTGVRAYPYFMAASGRVRASDPREQYLPTLDTTLWQYRGTSFGAGMNTLQMLTCEVKPTTSSALYQRT